MVEKLFLVLICNKKIAKEIVEKEPHTRLILNGIAMHIGSEAGNYTYLIDDGITELKQIAKKYNIDNRIRLSNCVTLLENTIKSVILKRYKDVRYTDTDSYFEFSINKAINETILKLQVEKLLQKNNIDLNFGAVLVYTKVDRTVVYITK